MREPKTTIRVTVSFEPAGWTIPDLQDPMLEALRAPIHALVIMAVKKRIAAERGRIAALERRVAAIKREMVRDRAAQEAFLHKRLPGWCRLPPTEEA